MYAMEANVSKYTNAIGSGKQAMTQRQKRKGGGGMREGWEYKKLGDSRVIEYGTRVVQKKDGGTIYPVYGGGGETFRMDKYNRENCLVVARFAMSRTCVRYVTGKFFLNDSGLSINAGKELLQSYLNHHILHLNDDIYNLGKGAAQRNLDVNSFRNLIIAIPPLSTQLSIVSELDKINELISLKKEQLKDYDNLAQSIFYEMFGDPVVKEKGWEIKKLGEVSMIKTGPFGSMLHKEDYITGGIPLINPMHIQNFKAVPDKDFSISKEKAAELCNYQLKINDVIFARRGDIGRCAVISDKEAGCLCGTGSLFVRFERKLSSIYTMYVVRTTSFIKELVSKAKGATMLNLNSSTMENLRFPIPPLPLQQLFAQRIELIEKQKAEVQRTIADLETLLASRMQYWFD